MKIIKEGSKILPPWKKTITCNLYNQEAQAICSAVFEINEKDCAKNEFGDQDEKCTDYTHFVECPTCKTNIHIPELDYSQKWR